MSARKLVEDIEHFRKRVLQDALAEATSSHWRRRAEDFRRVGTARCDEVAIACERRAELSLVGGDWPELDDLLWDDAS